MGAPFSSLAVANRFVEIANEAGCRDLTLMKLLKVVYFAHGWHLAITDNPLIDEQVEAWKFGPVAPDVYHNFKHVGASAIFSPAHTFVDFDLNNPNSEIKFVTPTVPQEPIMDGFLKRIWEIYGKATAFQLSELTHKDGTPWHTIWYKEGGSERKNVDIPDPIIKEYFKQKISVNATKSA